MHNHIQSGLLSPFCPALLTLGLLAAAFVYCRGWFRIRRSAGSRIQLWRLAAFVGGLCTVWLAAVSPLSALDHELLSAHMVQHLSLMTVAAPLILFGAPALPLLHGLPGPFIRGAAGRFLKWWPVRRVGQIISHPVFCWSAAIAAVMLWHFPPMFEIGMRSETWHLIEHLSFLATGLLFWWPVIQPWPSVAGWPRWSIPLYLFLATMPCDALSAYLAFCGRVVYPHYSSAVRPLNILALEDQQWAGALMWVYVTFVYLIPAVVITMQMLSPREMHAEAQLIAEPGVPVYQLDQAEAKVF